MRRLDRFRMTGIISAAILLSIAGLKLNAPADGTSLARETLKSYEGFPKDTTEEDILRFEKKLRKDVGSLSDPERVEFLHAIIRQKEKDSQSEGAEAAGWPVVSLFNWSGAAREDFLQAAGTFFETGTPEDDRIAERWLSYFGPPPSCEAKDLDVYRPAIEKAGGPARQKIVLMLFERHPGAAVEWFSNNSAMDENERERLSKELPTVRIIANPPPSYPNQPAPVELITPDEKARKREQWLKDDSWILRHFAKVLLIRNPALQTPELKATIDNVDVPRDLKLIPH